ncbi:DUF3052 family protein [Fimbriiglobus ruber]|uniref:DUF3052 domain-containing protein n=1 Tax=Fimbriiglobus ruber TaxID=1908690 RepID=A0A225DWD5_9BACT|nr:DUF3052 family protein [Fimbriiglobus ruber]OWK45701.1 hypothetical protein FRUB_02032 [Fimbriiglobus ruber]
MKTVAQKLFIKSGMKVRVIAKPENFSEIFGSHDAVIVSERSRELADLVLLFVRDREEMEARLGKPQILQPEGALWLAYPKGTSKLKSDIHRDSIREYAASLGLETVSIISVDETWSCLRLKTTQQK